MSRPWLIIQVLAAGALFYTGLCSASATSNSVLYDQLNACIDLQFELAQSPQSFSEIDLAASCPDLLLSLTNSDWPEKTAFRQTEHASLAQLTDLRYFLLGSFREPDTVATLDFSRLESILTETLVTAEPGQGQSWWEWLLNWLQQRHKDRHDVDLQWLEALLEKLSLSESAAEFVVYGIAVLLILLAVGLVINEIRLARRGRSMFRARQATRQGPVTVVPADTVTFSEIPQLPHNIPGLLNVCIDYLISHQRLPEIRSNTNREYLLHLTGRGDNAAPGFEQLLQQAERILYGGRKADAPALKQCRQLAQRLLETPGNKDAVPATAVGTH